jgi:hypothetical protein
MDFSNCRLFQESKNHDGSKNSYCDLSGEKTCCTGDILYCERSDTLRDYVLSKLEKRTGNSKTGGIMFVSAVSK